MHVLTLIAPQTAPLTEAVLRRVSAALPGSRTVWLAADEAADVFVAGAPDLTLVAAALEGAAVDAIAQPEAGRRKRLLVADMDSTIVTSETLDELAAYAGLKDRIAAITARSMNGEMDFRAALALRVGLLKGLALSALEATWQTTEMMPGAADLVATLRAHGATCALVSGGFTWFTGRVAARLGFDLHFANRLLDDGAALTGELAEPVLDRAAKCRVLHELAASMGLSLAETMAVGDGANDLDMLRDAGIGVAYHAKPIVAREARASVDHTDLRSLLFIQGYRPPAYGLVWDKG